ncbi:MAG: 6-carboxytetrahydropterin synthase QueD [Clostridiales bacterium]|nr:6-carboxytetrahydropterin synthase QueD [Clostridiales bacterium]
MYYLKTSASFDSAHFLQGYDGKCANLHGHHWVIEVEISGDQLQKNGSCNGMLVDFGDLKQAVRELANRFDHTLIYEKNSLKPDTEAALLSENFHSISVDFRPTAENFARCFFEKLYEKGLPIYRVTVYETPDNCAVYEV